MQDLWTHLMGGFATAASGANLMWAFIGCALGTAIGVLPGLGPAVTVAMLLPITAQVDPTASMIFFAGVSVPVTFDICVSATILVFGVSSFSKASRSNVPSSVIGAHLIAAPLLSR